MAVFGRWGRRGPYEKGQISIRYSKTLKIMEIIGIILVLAIALITAIKYPGMPDQVPFHFGASGEVDSLGPKSNLWIVPGSCIMIYVLITLAGFFPGSWNFPKNINMEKLHLAEDTMRMMLMCLKIVITIMMGYMQIMVMKTTGTASMYVLFGFLIVMMAIVMYFMVKIRKL